VNSKYKIFAIGALGGSGTRAVAQILMDAGVYMGDDLNVSNDNLLFTRLFKNPEWRRNASDGDIKNRLEIFRKVMAGEVLTSGENKELVKAAKENRTFKSDFRFYLKTLLKRQRFSPVRKTWGWKEPNTQIYLEEISAFFPELKYIHVLRHGLDMAFSGNIQQLHNWGFRFNIILTGEENKEELAVKQLDYWIRSTAAVLEQGKHIDERFYLLNYTKLYSQPQAEIENLLVFAGLKVDQKIGKKLIGIPQKPLSADRYKRFDTGIFRADQLDFVRKLGFKV
jgi:hypothetical protein